MIATVMRKVSMTKASRYIRSQNLIAMKETMYLLSVPDMLGSLKEAESMDISECATWDSLKDIL